MIKKIIARLCTTLIVGVSLGLPTVFAQSGNVPIEYFPNYHINEDWEILLDYFVELEAASKIGSDIPPSLFREMNDIFSTIFDYFPQSSANEIIYRQCDLITDDLSDNVTRSKYVTFKDKCFGPLGKIIKDINTKYIVKAEITAKPKSGSAPLNVTFDARQSFDPSIDTIPDQNFFWYYKDIHGVNQPIGKGQVTNYTFEEPGNHVVHLTVRSSNNITEGIFDGEATVNINVSPKAANMIVFVNGKKATQEKLLKIGSQDAREGLLIDGTATVPIGERTIVEHQWTISSTDQALQEKIPSPGSPSQFIYQFPRNGVYKILLEIIDNEGNRLKEEYNISVSDPVSIIKFKPEKGTTSTEFTFDASASYSITSRVKKYQRMITDPNGKQIDLVETKELRRSFSAPGNYTIKLTVIDEQGSSSFDTQQVFVTSTPPVPSFIVTSQSEWKYPSQFILDASGTFDEDVRTGNDSLKYSRLFSNSSAIQVDRSLEEDGSKVRISINEPGTYKVKLITEDSHGEIEEVEKDIEVESTLRPEVLISPLVGTRGSPVTFVAKVNKPVAFYNWDFGDGKKQQSKDPKVSHEYQKAGSYKVTLNVVTQDNEENEIVTYVFMGQKDMPVAAYQIKGPGNTLLQQQDSCENGTGSESAFSVVRYESIVIDASVSTNAQGSNTDTNIAFHPKNDQVYNKSVLSYNFPELGCSYVDLFVEDTNVGKTSSQRIRFKVNNALPELQNITLTFPQTGGGNPVGVGTNTDFLGENEIFTNPDLASVIVKVQAKGARDPDGFISHFRWFYFPSDDPTRKEGFKITPSDVPYVTFIIPKPPYATEYAFGVELIDNDDGKVASEDIVGKGPVIFFPPGENSLDVPIVTLTTNSLTSRVGEEVTFTTKSSILSERPDFEANRYFKYDFDGDGIYDIPSTKKEKVKHTYTKAGEMKPKVSVFYRGRAGVGTTEPITILKGLKPRFVIASHGKNALVKDFSIGDIIQTTFCMDSANSESCDEEDDTALIAGKETFMYTFPEQGNYLVKMEVKDEFGNIQNSRRAVEITDKGTEDIGILSLPEGIETGTGGFEIAVSEASNNSVDMFVSREGNCYVDLDITADSNGDGDPTIDEDVPCNELSSFTLYPQGQRQQGKLYYVKGRKIIEKDIHFLFLDVEEVPIPEERKEVHKELSELIGMSNPKEDDTLGKYYKELLINLRASLGEDDEMSSIIIQLRDLLASDSSILNDEESLKANNLINALSNSYVQSAFGGTVYDTSKANILIRFQGEDKKSASELFAKFEQANGNKETSKAVLDEVFTLAGDARSRGSIDEVDFNYIKTNLCDIVLYYELPSVTCGTILDTEGVEGVSTVDNSPGKKSVIAKVLTIFLRVFLALILVLGVIIVVFAIKAKRKKQDSSESE